MVDADVDGCVWYMNDPNTFLNGEDSEKVIRIKGGQREWQQRLQIENDQVGVNQKGYYKHGIHSFIVQADPRLSKNDKDP